MVVFALSALVSSTDAQETPAAKSKAKTQKKAGAVTTPDEAPRVKSSTASPPKVVRRVPQYFGGLSLSNEQKESIYAVEGEYQPRIQELERQADALRERLMTECEDVLTAPQKKALAEARRSAAERRKSSSARRKAESADESAPESADAEAPAPRTNGEPPARKPATID
jgi:hypothetical protein